MANNVVSEVFSYFGIKINPGEEMKLRDLANVLGNLSMSSVLAATGLGAAGAAIGEFAEKTAGASLDLQNLALFLDMPQQVITQWREYFAVLGAGAGEADSMFKNLKNARANMMREGGQGEWIHFGLDPTEKDPTKQFMNVAKALHTRVHDSGFRNLLAKDFGFNEKQTDMLIRAGNDPDKFLKGVHDRPILSDEAVGKWAELQQTWSMMTQDTIKLLEKMTPVADFMNWFVKSISIAHFGENAKEGFYGPGPQLLANAASAAGGATMTNHITVHMNGSGGTEGDGKKIGDSVADAVKQIYSMFPWR